MKIIEDRYTSRLVKYPRIVYCKSCQSKLELENGDAKCNKKDDIGLCVEITFVCPLCNKMNWAVTERGYSGEA